MAKTWHFRARMNQRRITDQMVELVLQFGAKCPDGKVVLNKKALKSARMELEKNIRLIDQALKRSGLVVIQDDATLITTYSLNTR